MPKSLSSATTLQILWHLTNRLQDKVYDGFLRVAVEGNPATQNVPFNLINPSEIESFEKAVSTCSQTTNREIELLDVFHFLGQVFPGQAPLLQTAQPSLQALLHAHARFPFSRPTPLTRAALLRAVMLLTWRGSHFFSRHAISPARRNAYDRLTYIFYTLATPNAGVGIVNCDDVVEVLTRLPYPLPSNPKHSLGKSREDFESMARRLDPPSDIDPKISLQVSRDTLAPLALLASSFTGEGGNTHIPTTSLSLDQFLALAINMQLFEALDQLFGIMLQPDHKIRNAQG
jgi:hypothetical protein